LFVIKKKKKREELRRTEKGSVREGKGKVSRERREGKC